MNLCQTDRERSRNIFRNHRVRDPSANNRLIDTSQTAREKSEIFIRNQEVHDPTTPLSTVTVHDRRNLPC
jgi:hypothetical protein